MEFFDDIVKKTLQYGEKLGVYLVLRIQKTKAKYIVINNGETEEMSYNEAGGIGIQVFTKDGGCGFASSEKIDQESCLQMVEIAANIAFQIDKRGGKKNKEIFKISSIKDKAYASVKYPFDYLKIEEEEIQLLKFNKEIIDSYNCISIETFYKFIEDQWRIIRSDGTDVFYNLPRVAISNTITAKAGNTATTRSAISGSDASILIDKDKRDCLVKRTKNACNLAIELLEAPTIKGGSYKIILDYPLAKGLAHEAFGHAVESDGLKTSILGDSKGGFNKGQAVASSIVSIIDESVDGDYAYQPYSANGVKRRPVNIVEKGILQEALSDVFSASEAAVPITGAGRVESYRHIPLPRMSNIRIEVEGFVPMEKEIEDVTPEELYKILLENNLAEPHEEIIYLVGYKGGQVKPSQGEFVFNCSGIYLLGDSCKLYQPAIFSGKVLSALKAIIGALGELKLDAQGTCGKAGQSVPSSGGSHYFIVLEANKDVIIGGA
ncbi:TldD/PmbA family protein [Alkaliphilus peptidifermentans]|uniref:TldD protein n=1 Tax=Alkaliphilus peptidifermentans DSM 18978 TaxID=1120976 RepID=A0A1G5ATN0_9FIRM|nr:TldD/PmbA family protein [Alkaliphilus peptidifermentans]SCX81160.1 TldD protein [Alkaliphilus peptidifermentans DSM 18978]